ncbi:SCO3374 family protein [Streptomyces sp. NPDC054796]
MTFMIPRPRAALCAARERGGCGGGPDGPGGRAEALEMPEDAGLALLRRPEVHTGPVAHDPARRRLQLLVPEGSAEELPGLLEWLEWRGIELELSARAPFDPREAAIWLRPPEPGRGADHVDLVRLVSAAATECHRARLTRTAVPRVRKPGEISRWPSRTPRGYWREHGRGH